MAAGVGTGVVSALAAGTVVSAPSATADEHGPETRQDRIEQGLGVVRDQKGDAYGYGADGPSRFDCSGLVYYAFQRAGFEHVPRTSSAQARHMNRIDRSDMRPGDFVFFYDGAATAEHVNHVGSNSAWEAGPRMIDHAPSSDKHLLCPV